MGHIEKNLSPQLWPPGVEQRPPTESHPAKWKGLNSSHFAFRNSTTFWCFKKLWVWFFLGHSIFWLEHKAASIFWLLLTCRSTLLWYLYWKESASFITPSGLIWPIWLCCCCFRQQSDCWDFLDALLGLLARASWDCHKLLDRWDQDRSIQLVSLLCHGTSRRSIELVCLAPRAACTWLPACWCLCKLAFWTRWFCTVCHPNRCHPPPPTPFPSFRSFTCPSWQLQQTHGASESGPKIPWLVVCFASWNIWLSILFIPNSLENKHVSKWINTFIISNSLFIIPK